MTGRDLIIYILENNLEDELVFDSDRFLGFISANEAAIKFGVGTTTIKLWYELDIIPGVKIGDNLYIPSNITKGVE